MISKFFMPLLIKSRYFSKKNTKMWWVLREGNLCSSIVVIYTTLSLVMLLFSRVGFEPALSQPQTNAFDHSATTTLILLAHTSCMNKYINSHSPLNTAVSHCCSWKHKCEAELISPLFNFRRIDLRIFELLFHNYCQSSAIFLHQKILPVSVGFEPADSLPHSLVRVAWTLVVREIGIQWNAWVEKIQCRYRFHFCWGIWLTTIPQKCLTYFTQFRYLCTVKTFLSHDRKNRFRTKSLKGHLGQICFSKRTLCPKRLFSMHISHKRVNENGLWV